MALSNEKVFRNFVKGIVTEASPLTFPEDSSIDEQNFILKRDGSRERRLGVDYESDYSLNETGITSEAIASSKQSFHIWNTSGGNTSINIGVVRIANKLWFLDMLTSNPSANLLNGGSPLVLSELDKADIDTAVINTDFIIVSDDLSYPLRLSYDSVADLVSSHDIEIKVRDIWGVVDGLEIDKRPDTLSDEHLYNLRNQGWNKEIVTDSPYEAILDYENLQGKYPSNADNWTLGRNTNPTSGDYEKFQGNRMTRNSVGNSPAPKGALILDAFNRGTSRITIANTPPDVGGGKTFAPDITSLPLDRELGKITSIASFAGRIFYSGVKSSITDPDDKSPNYSNYVFFTQVVTNNERLSKCYQEADPTSPTINDLIDSDGGTVAIPECNQIVRIAATKSSLLIFGDNGVWELFGDTQGFVATSFQVAKVSTNGVYGSKAIVTTGDSFIYWSKAGIYALTSDGGSGRFSTQNISLTSIQTLYLTIPDLAKQFAKGFFDEKENTVRWLYNDNDGYGTSEPLNKYNKELVYDITLQAFYVNKISDLSSNSPYVAAYVQVPGFILADETSEVLVGTDTVLSGTDVVVINETYAINKSSQFSFLTVTGTAFTLSKYRDISYWDWETEGNGTGAYYDSYMVTGYEMFDDLLRDKTTPYITFYFRRSEDGYQLLDGNLELTNPSSCLVQAQWNWADSANSGKWGNQFQAYRLKRHYIPSGVGDTFDYGDSVIVTKHKLRGSGKCLSLKINSENGKALNILGWGITANAHNKV